jgi:hypothetical protein
MFQKIIYTEQRFEVVSSPYNHSHRGIGEMQMRERGNVLVHNSGMTQF